MSRSKQNKKSKADPKAPAKRAVSKDTLDASPLKSRKYSGTGKVRIKSLKLDPASEAVQKMRRAGQRKNCLYLEGGDEASVVFNRMPFTRSLSSGEKGVLRILLQQLIADEKLIEKDKEVDIKSILTRHYRDNASAKLIAELIYRELDNSKALTSPTEAQDGTTDASEVDSHSEFGARSTTNDTSASVSPPSNQAKRGRPKLPPGERLIRVDGTLSIMRQDFEEMTKAVESGDVKTGQEWIRAQLDIARKYRKKPN